MSPRGAPRRAPRRTDAKANTRRRIFDAALEVFAREFGAVNEFVTQWLQGASRICPPRYRQLSTLLRRSVGARSGRQHPQTQSHSEAPAPK